MILNWLQEVLLPFIIKVMVHKREKLTQKERRAQARFLSELLVSKRKTKKPVVVAMIGLVGSGKSSVAYELAKYIGATVIEGDKIRIELRKEEERYEGARKIAENVALEIIKNGGNVIFDSDHIDPAKRASLRAKAKEVGAELIFIRTYTDTSDNSEIPGFNLDEMIGRNMTADYTGSADDFFGGAKTPFQGTDQQKGAVVKLREMARRLPQHYRWVNKTGGRWVLRKLPFKVFAEINTAYPEWKKKVEKITGKILKKF
ncbi:MAG: AAA family ATPase [Candidatus Terrybacteria bacterium]|nr:AAA family ATPase [Candidatus Terrybacteria bacterium]